MLYQKNLPQWERWLRIAVGVALMGYGLLGSPSVLGTGIMLISAAVVIITGFIGFCPACAMIGRAPVQKNKIK